MAVVTAVAGRAGVDETGLPPLSEVLDPDALDRLFARPGGGPAGVPDEVRFEYCGVEVVVGADRTVRIESADRSPDAPEDEP